MIIYRKWGVSPGAKATTRGPFIFVDPAFASDPGLVPHEEVHVAQFWRTFGLHVLLYRFNASYRLKAEVEAYKVQLQCYPAGERDARQVDYAAYLASHYSLNITQEQAMQALAS